MSFNQHLLKASAQFAYLENEDGLKELVSRLIVLQAMES
jgi:hypothetical protein